MTTPANTAMNPNPVVLHTGSKDEAMRRAKEIQGCAIECAPERPQDPPAYYVTRYRPRSLYADETIL